MEGVDVECPQKPERCTVTMVQKKKKREREIRIRLRKNKETPFKEKDLGVHLSSDLKSAQHIGVFFAKANKMVCKGAKSPMGGRSN